MDSPRSLAESATLEHLILEPVGGLGNMLRAIAAARRLCSLVGARCTVLWGEFGDYDALFAPDPAVRVIRELSVTGVGGSSRCLDMPKKHAGGHPGNRRVPVCQDSTLHVRSNFFFCAEEEPLVDADDVLGDWLPHPSQVIADEVRDFARAHFKRTVGVHIRHGDNGKALVVPSIETFVSEAEPLVEAGHTIFLSTDSTEAEQEMRARFGNHVTVYPKIWDWPFRWPTPAGCGELAVDFLDMQLLAACEYVVGWAKSSFSRVAVHYNGSPRCHLIAGPPLHPQWGRYLEPSAGGRATPATVTIDGTLLARVKERLRAGAPTLNAMMARQRRAAEGTLKMAPCSVTEKRETPPSGGGSTYWSRRSESWRSGGTSLRTPVMRSTQPCSSGPGSWTRQPE